MVSPANSKKFSDAYDEFAAQILSYTVRRCASQEMAADIMAETFTIAWTKVEELPDGKNAKYWLYAVARRLMANQYRRNQKGDNLAAALQQTYAAESNQFADATVDKLIVRDALSKLDPQEFELVTLTNWEGLNSTEIAQILDVSPVTVRTRLNRIRAKLRLDLEANPNFSEVSRNT